jgi:hypothetical protein
LVLPSSSAPWTFRVVAVLLSRYRLQLPPSASRVEALPMRASASPLPLLPSRSPVPLTRMM